MKPLTAASPARAPAPLPLPFPGSKLVRDWDHRPVGWLRHQRFDPRTRDPRSLVIALSDEARALAGVVGQELVIPADLVFSIRRDELVLGCTVEDIRREGLGCWAVRSPGARRA